MGLQIYANIDATSLNSARVQSANDLRPKPFKQLAAGDSAVIDLFLTGQDGLENIQDYSTVRLGIGALNARPTGGTWDLGAQTGLAYNISATALDTAITAEVAACAVTEVTSFVYKVVFDANGAQSIPTVDATSLTPSSTVSIKRLVTGDASTKEEWLIRLYKNPIALVDSFTNITGSGIRGTLSLGTVGIYELLGTSTSAETTIELELTDANGDIATIFQYPVTITGEVLGEGVTGVATFDSYITSSAVSNKFLRGKLIFVDSVNGSDSSGTAYRGDLPYLTVNAASNTAASGDTLIIYPGDYTAESPVTPTVSLNIVGLEGALLPSILAQGVDLEIVGDCGFGVEALSSGNLKIKNSTIVSDGTYGGRPPLNIGGSHNVTLENCRITSTESGAEVIGVAASWGGTLFAKNCEFIATTVTTNEATTGILYGATVTGTVQLKDCTFITAQNGTGIAYSIAPTGTATATIYVQGAINQTHAVATYVTLAGGTANTRTEYTA